MKKIVLTLFLLSLTMPLYSGQWYNDAVFYEIFVRSFYDSNGDGVGDLNGVIAKLDYLNDGNPATTDDLGVTAIWLMPIFQSRSYHGYDTDDYYAIDDEYGTMEDFERLVAEAHKRGMRVILDLVINHTSKYIDWFTKSEQRVAPYTDFYVWKTNMPSQDSGWSRPWGGGTARDVWYRDSVRGEYYFAAFWSGMPDLNYGSDMMKKEIFKIAKFWLLKGVDGYRLDAARFLYEIGPGLGSDGEADTPQTVQFWVDLKAYMRAIKADSMLVGEVWVGSATQALYYRNGKGLDLVFDFEFADKISLASKFGNFQQIKSIISNKLTLPVPFTFYAPFLANHDTTRAMNIMQNDFNAAKIAATILLTMPGTPFMYYGEEIGLYQGEGMSGDAYKRTPMQWNFEHNAGFTTGTPWEALTTTEIPYIVQYQSYLPNSLLSLYRRLIRIRTENPELRSTKIELLATTSSKVFAYVRSGDGNKKIVVIINGSVEEKTETLTFLAGKKFINLLTGEAVSYEGGTITLTAKTALILKLVP